MKNFLGYIITIAVVAYSFLNAHQPVWDAELNHEQIEQQLKEESVISHERIQKFLRKQGKIAGGDKRIQIVTLKNGLKAVFKPGYYRFAEVAAYEASKALKLRLVPPTVIRTIDGEEGSLQFFVESNIDLRERMKHYNMFSKLQPKLLSDMKIFYFVFGQWDGHPGNQILTRSRGNYYLALIDNAGIYHRQYIKYGDFPFMQRGMNKNIPSSDTPSFPFNEAKVFYPKSYEHLRKFLSPFVDSYQIKRTWEHHRPITYVIWNHIFFTQVHKHVPQARPNYTRQYYASTIHALKELDRQKLELMWTEGIKQEPERCLELIEKTLERKEQLLAHVAKHGNIIAD